MYKYEVLVDSDISDIKAGEVVFKIRKSDYGVSRDDSLIFGYECVSVTRDSEGDYPFVSMPRHNLKRID